MIVNRECLLAFYDGITDLALGFAACRSGDDALANLQARQGLAHFSTARLACSVEEFAAQIQHREINLMDVLQRSNRDAVQSGLLSVFLFSMRNLEDAELPVNPDMAHTRLFFDPHGTCIELASNRERFIPLDYGSSPYDDIPTVISPDSLAYLWQVGILIASAYHEVYSDSFGARERLVVAHSAVHYAMCLNDDPLFMPRMRAIQDFVSANHALNGVDNFRRRAAGTFYDLMVILQDAGCLVNAAEILRRLIDQPSATIQEMIAARDPRSYLPENYPGERGGVPARFSLAGTDLQATLIWGSESIAFGSIRITPYGAEFGPISVGVEFPDGTEIDGIEIHRIDLDAAAPARPRHHFTIRRLFER